ncbi:MAG TPA: hypothetical protein VF895_11865 [Gaiellaceae bacterium]
MRRVIRSGCWAGGLVLVILAARALAYALSPSPLARAFEHQVGGPSLPFVTIGALGAGLGLAAVIIALASMGVRERAQLEVAEAPKLRLRRLAVRAVLLFAAASAGFDLFDSYTHWRAGLGWHGIDCLTGPVHRNAIPFLAAFSLIACALAAAFEHVLAWMRRTIERIRAAGLRFAPRPLVLAFPDVHARPAPVAVASLGARGPPFAD